MANESISDITIKCVSYNHACTTVISLTTLDRQINDSSLTMDYLHIASISISINHWKFMLDNIPEVFIETTVDDFQWFPD